MRYKILTANDIADLEKQVNAYINEGWRLIGGVAAAVTSSIDSWGNTKDYWEYIQAVMREGASE